MAAVISHTVLIVAEPFAGQSAQRVAGAIERGLRAGTHTLSVDVLALEDTPRSAREWWATAEHNARLRAARAVVIAAARLDERTLAGSVAFELATSARQAGVPAYAVTGENALDLFDARMLDLQAVLQAASSRALGSAGRKLAELI
jgi:glycerate kinase